MKHEGNERFRKLIKHALPKYSEAIQKWEKTGIVTAIIETTKNKSKGGGFVRCVDDRWYLVGTSRTCLRWCTILYYRTNCCTILNFTLAGDQAAREKIGQT